MAVIARTQALSAGLIATLLSSTCLISADAATTRATESRITGITVSGTQILGAYNGVAYVRTYGMVKGVVDANEDVVGLAPLPKNADGKFEYTTEFEIIAPAPGEPSNEVVFIDSENR